MLNEVDEICDAARWGIVLLMVQKSGLPVEVGSLSTIMCI